MLRHRLRTPVLASALLLISAACGGSTTETSFTLPPIPEALPSVPETSETTAAPQSTDQSNDGSTQGSSPSSATTTAPGGAAAPMCELATNSGSGAEITSVPAGSPAAATFRPDDVIVAVDGESVENASDLLAIVRSRSVGDSIVATVQRDADEIDVAAVLASNPENPGQPLIGVNVETVIEFIDAAEYPRFDVEASGNPIITMLINSDLYLADVIGGQWLPVLPEGPTSWVTNLRDVHILTAAEGEPIRISGLFGRQTVDLFTEGWTLLGMVTSIGDLALVAAENANTPQDFGLLAFEIGTGELQWQWKPTDAGGPSGLAPLLGFANASRDRVILRLLDAEGGSQYVVLDESGKELTGWPTSSADFIEPAAIVIGWYDDRSMLLAGGERGGIRAISIDDGTSSLVTLPPIQADLEQAWTVGDGRHVIGRTETELLLLDTADGGEARPIARGCDLNRVGEPGLGT